jgi:hypothetical protein
MYEVKWVDVTNTDQIVAEYDMSVDSRHDTEDGAEARRKEIEASNLGARAWALLWPCGA